ncbi:uncharacterized protein LOC103313049 isoform X2 [Tribolium castaneum]|uniref:uncharacterized protein LOC103313049 isoform X2 n=1 Tax=Tribolium castaneum TaxID=7070 RepID=UPI0030FE1AF0
MGIKKGANACKISPFCAFRSNIGDFSKMKTAFLLLFVLMPAVLCYYVHPNLHYFPARVNYRSAPAKSWGALFHRLQLASKRCANTFDESCINDVINGAGSDEAFLNGGDNPGKRCVNTFDESCSNGDINGAGSDDDWLHGDDTPGRR